MTTRYAVIGCYPAIVPLEGFEIKGFGMSLQEAFEHIMSQTVDTFEFKRVNGVMGLTIKAREPREDLPCDGWYLKADGDPFTSTNPDDAAARAEIMKRVGERDWHGLFLAAYKEPLTADELLGNFNALLEAAAAA